jgi:ABC-type branched-subunit amino acid transport system substrate-binding protein
LRVRDSESNPERAAAAVDELAREGVAAIVASPDRAEASAAAARAEALGLPLLELAPDETRRGGLLFKLIRANPARAEALAARAVAAGAIRVAVLFPESGYGRKMGETFAAAARARYAEVVAEIAFDEKTTTFIAPAKRLAKLRPDAVFVPGPAAQLELIAAQLAATGVIRTQGGRAKRGARSATLYATADGLTARLLQSAGRYVQGAVLAPVFYADAADPQLGPFVAQFRAAYGEEPGAADALGFDAVRAIRAALAQVDPRRGRAELGRLIAAGREVGATGVLGFGPGGERTGAPQLYVVDGEAIRALR